MGKNNNNKIFYLGYYDSPKFNRENRHYYPSAAVKIDNIWCALQRIGKSIQIISLSWTDNHKGFFRGRNTQISENVFLRCFSSVGFFFSFLRRVGIFLIRLKAFIYLLFALSSGAALIVYHSPSIISFVSCLRHLKKFNLIMEVEEFYFDVIEYKKLKPEKELSFLKGADHYIFCADSTRQVLDPDKTKSAIIYGSYEYWGGVFQNSKRIVYAGSLGGKKGPETALASCEFLDSSYEMDFLLFGPKNEYLAFEEKIREMRLKSSCKILSFSQTLQGADFFVFLSSYQVGMAAQKSGEKFDKTSFPSKILAYLSCDLNVVVNKLDVVENSAISDFVFYAETDNPKDIAQTIIKACATPKMSHKNLFDQLNGDFIASLQGIIS